jgi:hypothetical protein
MIIEQATTNTDAAPGDQDFSQEKISSFGMLLQALPNAKTLSLSQQQLIIFKVKGGQSDEKEKSDRQKIPEIFFQNSFNKPWCELQPQLTVAMDTNNDQQQQQSSGGGYEAVSRYLNFVMISIACNAWLLIRRQKQHINQEG